MKNEARFRTLCLSWASERAKQERRPVPQEVDLPSHLPRKAYADFLRGMDAGIFTVKANGRCMIPKIRRKPTKPTEPRLMSFREGEAYLAWVEYVVQVGALSRLALDFNYPLGLLALDPADWVFDLAVYADSSDESPMVIAGEVKPARQSLLAEISAINRGHSKKHAGLLTWQPTYFWAVSADYERTFEVRYDETGPSLSRIETLPKYGDVDFRPIF